MKISSNPMAMNMTKPLTVNKEKASVPADRANVDENVSKGGSADSSLRARLKELNATVVQMQQGGVDAKSGVAAENMIAANSSIPDAGVAAALMNIASSSIVNNAQQAVQAQANSTPADVMSVLE